MSNPIIIMHPLAGNYLVVSNLSTLLMYEYDSGASQYVLNYTYNFVAVSNLAYAFSVDGKMIVQIYHGVAANDFTMVIHELNTGTGQYTPTVLSMGFPAGTTKYIRDANMIIRGGVYILIAVMQDGSTHYLKYYHITTGSTFNEQQQIYSGLTFLNYEYLTQNGNFLAVEAQSTLYYF